MKLEQQVVSLELAKRLLDLMGKKPSLFFWKETHWTSGNGDSSEWRVHHIDDVALEVKKSNPPFIPAYTVADLGEMLPAGVVEVSRLNGREDKGHLYYMKWDDWDKDCDGSNKDTCIKKQWQGEIGRQIFNDDTEANCRAKMLIYLIENNLISLTK